MGGREQRCAPGMRLGVALGGTDIGRSGLAVHVRAVLPRLHERLSAASGEMVLFGTRAELCAYGSMAPGAEQIMIGEAWKPSWRNALWHLFFAGRAAARARVDVLLLPAANRRMTAYCPV